MKRLLFSLLALLASGCKGSSPAADAFPLGERAGDLALPSDGPRGDLGPLALGDFSRFADLGWIDLHVHMQSHRRIEPYVAWQDRFGIKRMALQVVPNYRSLTEGGRPNFNAEAFLAKLKHPDRFYVFAGLDLTQLPKGAAALESDLATQIDQLADAGADGLKLYFRYTLVEPFKKAFAFDYLPDNPAFGKALARAEARGLPVLIHIDEQYLASGSAALAAHPGLTWIVTHMAWAATDLARLDTILDRSPKTFIDVGHYVHLGPFVAAGKPAADYLDRRRTRIFQSTDFGSGCDLAKLEPDECPNEALAVDQTWKLRVMLETHETQVVDDLYKGGKLTVAGLGLPAEILRPLYRDNAQKLLGDPKKVSCAAALAHVDTLKARTTAADDLARLAEIRGAMQALCP